MVLVILALGCFGLLTSTVFAGMVMAGGRHHWCEKTAAGRRYAPALTLLKPVHGDEAGLEAHLATFFEQDYPVYEILFCARDEADKGLAVARRVAAKYPQVAARFFWTGDAPYINAKVRSLEVMAAEARYDIYVISDSDVRVTREYLREVAAPFQDAKVGGMTCLYRGVAAEGGHERGDDRGRAGGEHAGRDAVCAGADDGVSACGGGADGRVPGNGGVLRG